MKLIKLNKILLLLVVDIASYCYSAESAVRVYDAQKAYNDYLEKVEYLEKNEGSRKRYEAIYGSIQSVPADLSRMVRDYAAISFEEFQKNSEDLIKAVQASDLKAVQNLLNRGVDVNVQNRVGSPVFAIALRIGSSDKKNAINGILSYVGIDNDADKIIDLLLDYPTIDINATTTKSSWPILMTAVNCGNLRVIERLLNDTRLNNVNEEDSRGDNALTWAAYKRFDKAVELLLKHSDIDPNAIGRHNKTVLIDAVFNGYSKIVSLLLMHPKTDVNMQYEGMTAKQWASMQSKHGIVDIFNGTVCSVQ